MGHRISYSRSEGGYVSDFGFISPPKDEKKREKYFALFREIGANAKRLDTGAPDGVNAYKIEFGKGSTSLYASHVDLNKESPSAHNIYATRNGAISSGKCETACKVGDIFRFKIDFDKRTCEIFQNGVSCGGAIFKDIPDEIIPVVSKTFGGQIGEIRFVEGRGR